MKTLYVVTKIPRLPPQRQMSHPGGTTPPRILDFNSPVHYVFDDHRLAYNFWLKIKNDPNFFVLKIIHEATFFENEGEVLL